MFNKIVIFLILSVLYYNSVCSYENADRNIKEPLYNYKDIKNKIESIKEQCGALCHVDPSTYRPIPNDSRFYYVPIEKQIDCNRLWNSSIFDDDGKFKRPPQRIPEYLLPYYKHHSDLIDIKYDYYDEINDNPWNQTFNKWAWTKDGIEYHIDSMKKGMLNGLYGKDVIGSIRHLSKKYIKLEGKHILIIGSIIPWIESLLISMNVGHITVLEYNPYPSTHPKITSISPPDFSELVISNQAPMFDGMISFSSLEHSGLGRYGDQLNPWGDIITMGRAWCQMKPGSRALVGFPAGKDTICFNAAKQYGSFLLPHVFTNWKQIYSEGNPHEILNREVECRIGTQPIHVLER